MSSSTNSKSVHGTSKPPKPLQSEIDNCQLGDNPRSDQTVGDKSEAGGGELGVGAKIDYGKLRAHEFAELFPLMSDADFRALEESIRINGLREPIVIYESKIVPREQFGSC